MNQVVLSRRLADLEADIEAGLRGYERAGQALRQIRDERLYLETGYSSFDAYCRDRWGFSRIHAYRQIDAAAVAGLLPTGNTAPPVTERQARELAPLVRADPAAVADVWQAAQAAHGPSPTAEQLRPLARAALDRVRTPATVGEAVCAPSAVTLYRGDCRAVLPTLPGDSVQLVVTSPPYNCGFSYADNGEADSLPLAEYQALLADALAGIYRVLQPGGVLALNLPPSIRTREYRAWPLAAWAQMHLAAGPWLLREPYAWVKGLDGEAYAVGTRVGAASNPYARPCHELIIVASKASYSIEGKTWENGTPLDTLKDVWHIAPSPIRKDSGLPQPFPDELARRLIDLYSRDGDVVLDPFAGLGTVGRVADGLGRSAWLIERERAYWPRLAALAGQAEQATA